MLSSLIAVRCNRLSVAKVFPCFSRRLQVQATRVLRKIFRHPADVAYLFTKNWQRLNTTFILPLKLDHNSPAPIRHKKKSEIMRSIEKNRKQRPTAYLPISIKLVVKIALVALGYCVWGTGFIWALVGLYLAYPFLRAIISMVVGFGVIIALLYFLFSFL